MFRSRLKIVSYSGTLRSETKSQVSGRCGSVVAAKMPASEEPLHEDALVVSFTPVGTAGLAGDYHAMVIDCSAETVIGWARDDYNDSSAQRPEGR
jgi:hypothetical protein